MDGKEMIDSLDSHWFYCSVFKPPPSSRSNYSNITPTHLKPPPCSSSNCSNITPTDLEDTHKQKEATPKIPIPHKQHSQSPSNGLEAIPEYDDLVLECESSEMEQRRIRSKRNCKLNSKRKERNPGKEEFEEVEGIVELGFDIEDVGLGSGLKTVSKYDILMAECGSYENEQRRIYRRSCNSDSKWRGMNRWIREFEKLSGLMELGFSNEEFGFDAGLPMGRFECPRRLYLHCKTPPFGNVVAMKEHLKSWAYAVACTVK